MEFRTRGKEKIRLQNLEPHSVQVQRYFAPPGKSPTK